MFDRVIHSRQPLQYEDSREGRHLLNFESPVLDSAGNVTRVAVFALDITERKQGEQAKEAFLSLAAKLSVARSPLEVARAISAALDLLWKWDSGTLDLWQQQSGQIETVLAWDVVNGRRREVTPDSPAGPPKTRTRRVMGEGAELILRKQGDLPERDRSVRRYLPSFSVNHVRPGARRGPIDRRPLDPELHAERLYPGRLANPPDAGGLLRRRGQAPPHRGGRQTARRAKPRDCDHRHGRFLYCGFCRRSPGRDH